MSIKAVKFPMTGTDLDAVNIARVSFDKFNDTFDEKKDVGLIKYLISHGHWTPMAHNRITFRSLYGTLNKPYEDVHPDLRSHLVNRYGEDGYTYERHSLHGWVQLIKAGHVTGFEGTSICKILTGMFPVAMGAYGLTNTNPHVRGDKLDAVTYKHPDFIDVSIQETVPIFVARQDFKHKGMFIENEVSRRYVSSEPEFYVPEVWRGKPEGSIKQGSAGVVEELVLHSLGVDGYKEPIDEVYKELIEDSFWVYQRMLENGVAPEMARMVLPQSMITQYIRTASLTAWSRMVNQRKDPHAQVEIQDLATQVDSVIRPMHRRLWSSLVEDV